LKKTTPGTVDSWRLPMIRQTFFPENFESVQTASKSDMRSLPVSANRGVMQRLAVGNGTQIQSMDANPPGTSADPRSPHFDDQLPLYGQWGFKPMPLSPQKTGAGKVVSASTGSKL
jgi:acyl-homoserine lactone acylase PvdQ